MDEDLRRQVAQALIGREEITHEARHLQARRQGDAAAPNGEGGDERLVEFCFEGVKKTKTIDVDED